MLFMRKMLVIGAAIAGFSVAQTHAGDVALGAKVGTLGLAGDLTIGISPAMNIRLNANYLYWEYDADIEDISYETELDYSSFMALLDVHPFSNGFRLTGGVIKNNNAISLYATPSDSTTIGGREYTPEQIGTITGTLDFEDVSPYAGIGFGHPFASGGPWSFVFDLGVVFQPYEVTLTADGLAAESRAFQKDLKEEEEDVQDFFDQMEIYPVLSFGIAYRF